MKPLSDKALKRKVLWLSAYGGLKVTLSIYFWLAGAGVGILGFGLIGLSMPFVGFGAGKLHQKLYRRRHRTPSELDDTAVTLESSP